MKEIEIDNENYSEIENEDKILRSFEHHNIVKYIESFTIVKNNKYYIIMELCESDLSTFINNKNNELIDEKVIYIILKDICFGLKELHSNNIIHRDLKPGNILISSDKKFKIADFGISKYNNQPLTSNKCTIKYAAPEFLKSYEEGIISYDKAIDLLSLGKIICDLCKCESPSVFNSFSSHVIINTKYNKQLENLINLLLTKDPKDRIDLHKTIIEINKLESQCQSIDKNLDKSHIEILNRKKENEIKIDVEILTNNEIIYFLDGESHEHLKELNQDNTELYFCNKNNRKVKIPHKFQKGFKFEFKGNYEILLKFKDKLSDSSYMFFNCSKIKNIDLTFLDTTNIFDMSKMFASTNLRNIDLSSFITIKVKNMNSMFSNCENLENIDLSSFDTSKVEDMSYMFNCCKNLKNINLNSFNTQFVKDMKFMFNSCENLENINLSSFKTSKVEDMSYMFNCCKNLKNINLNSFNTKNVKNMKYMFNSCENSEEIVLSSFDTSNVEDMNYMFNCCKNLIELKASFATCKVIAENMNNMFGSCTKLKIDNLFKDKK